MTAPTPQHAEPVGLVRVDENGLRWVDVLYPAGNELANNQRLYAHPVAAKPAFDIDEAMRLADEYANWEPVERDTNWHAERAALEAYLKANT